MEGTGKKPPSKDTEYLDLSLSDNKAKALRYSCEKATAKFDDFCSAEGFKISLPSTNIAVACSLSSPF